MLLTLSAAGAASAGAVQQAIDRVAAAGGGEVVLPACDLLLDRGLQLRTGVTLRGQGPATVLRKGPGAVWPLSGYHNYGMCDVPLESTADLSEGMTVSVHDRSTHGGFYETFATIEWVDEHAGWVGLDRGIDADYSASDEPCITTAYPVVFGHGVSNVRLADLHIEGSAALQDQKMGGCRGGAVYFAQSHNITLDSVTEADYDGEGLSFQMCRDVEIISCVFDRNSGNGLHPGAGSTNCLFRGCTANGNAMSGFFFCVRATLITVQDCTFARNGTGVSIGTRDCFNHIVGCTIINNRGAGVLARPTPAPTEVHSILIEGCEIRGNGKHNDDGGDDASSQQAGQVVLTSDAHDIVLVGNQIARGIAMAASIGLLCEESVRAVALQGNTFGDDLLADTAELGDSSANAPVHSNQATPVEFLCGYLGLGQDGGEALGAKASGASVWPSVAARYREPRLFRHLPPQSRL
jgi:polygalacturonase